MRRIVGVALVLATVVPTVAMAQQHQGSAEDQLACTPDVYRLCAGEIPDEDAITACLRRNKPRLSAGCKAVFSRPDSGKPAQTDDD